MCTRCALSNKRDDELLSPLHWAVMCEHPKHVEALLNSEADPVIGDNEGRTVSFSGRFLHVSLLCRVCIRKLLNVR